MMIEMSDEEKQIIAFPEESINSSDPSAHHNGLKKNKRAPSLEEGSIRPRRMESSLKSPDSFRYLILLQPRVCFTGIAAITYGYGMKKTFSIFQME
ncbi:hypothetical protein JTE90_000251 [Oedothorax gibbosus]|uniref:Uncharacterized protein n=1 Tax=Oedothorax gibbosus TaxID=931172 RepID=A0AAV6VUD9_9ARAC|nr:hypothetical protein JTE90_000251 [Oedothorax gibbosus]